MVLVLLAHAYPASHAATARSFLLEPHTVPQFDAIEHPHQRAPEEKAEREVPPQHRPLQRDHRGLQAERSTVHRKLQQASG